MRAGYLIGRRKPLTTHASVHPMPSMPIGGMSAIKGALRIAFFRLTQLFVERLSPQAIFPTLA